MLKRFSYDRHLTSGNEIRLISLHPSRGLDIIQATVRYHHVDDNLSYEALSYTWGSSFNNDNHQSWSQTQAAPQDVDIVLDFQLMKVTSSLHGALRRLQKSTGTRLIWCDAICIDQCHDEEKSWQIQKMRDIYARAAQVVVWLGPANNDSGLAMQTLASGYRSYRKTQPYQKLGQIQQDFPPPATQSEYLDQLTAASLGVLFGLTIKSDSPIPTYPIKAVASLLNRAYWGRGWCWQEFCVASKMCIMCGEETLEDGDMAIQIFLGTWDRLKATFGGQPHGMDHRAWAMMELRRSWHNIEWIEETGFVDDARFETPDDWMPLKSWASMNPNITDTGKAWMLREAVYKLSFKALLEESSISWLQTSKEHREDQVYALMGIASDSEDMGITIDYSQPWEQTYTQLALTYLRRGDLWFLNFCQSCLPEFRGRSRHLPSWAPDWSEGFRGARISQHWSPPKDHLGSFRPFTAPNLDKSLQSLQIRLRGIIADEIAWVSSERFPMSVNQLGTHHRQSLYEWITRVATHCYKHRRRDIWTVMIANSRNLPLPEKYKSEDTANAGSERVLLDTAFDHILDQGEPLRLFRRLHLHQRREADGEIVDSFLRCFMQATGFKCIFETKEGRLGLASVGIQKGDRIGVFMGNEAAFVLRPVQGASDKSSFRIMCEGYVHGLMTDERLMADAAVEDIVLE